MNKFFFSQTSLSSSGGLVPIESTTQATCLLTRRIFSIWLISADRLSTNHRIFVPLRCFCQTDDLLYRLISLLQLGFLLVSVVGIKSKRIKRWIDANLFVWFYEKQSFIPWHCSVMFHVMVFFDIFPAFEVFPFTKIAKQQLFATRCSSKLLLHCHISVGYFTTPFVYTFQSIISEKFALNRNEKVTRNKHETQCRRRNYGRHTMTCSIYSVSQFFKSFPISPLFTFFKFLQ